MDHSSFEKRAAAVLAKLDPEGLRRRVLPPPFGVELLGEPAAGKTTVQQGLRTYFKRCGATPSIIIEGAQVIELPRDDPEYNFQTADYSISEMRRRRHDHRFHIVIADRGPVDAAMRMEYFRSQGKITAEEQAHYEAYFLNPRNRSLYDLHVFLMVDPSVALSRTTSGALTKRPGETMNPKTLAELHAAHEQLWARLKGDQDPKMFWLDTTNLSREETLAQVLDAVLTACERRFGPPPPSPIIID